MLIFDGINYDRTKQLLKTGVDINAVGIFKENDSYSFLHAAVDICDMKLIEFILSQNPDVNILTKNFGPVDDDDDDDDDKNNLQSDLNKNRKAYCGYTPLHIAVTNNRLDIVKHLLTIGADPNTKLDNCHSVLYLAAKSASLEIIECLLEFNAEINQVSVFKSDSEENYDEDDILPPEYPKHYTALHIAVKLGRFDVIKLLISKGADLNINAMHNQSILYYAVCNGEYKIVDYLLEHGADVNHCDDVDIHLNQPPLIFAIKKNRLDIVKLLVSYGANIHDNGLAVKTAIEKGNFETVQFLIDHNFEVNTMHANYHDNQAPLNCAIQGEGIDIIELLLVNGADIWEYYTEESIFEYDHDTYIAAFVGKHVIKVKILKEYAGDLVNINLDSSEIKLPEILPYWSDEDDDDEDDNDEDEEIKGLKEFSRWELYKERCKNEIEKIRREFIGTSSLRYYDLLKKNKYQLAIFANNSSIRETILSDEIENQFPIYAGIIVNYFRKGMIRKDLLDKVEILLPEIFSKLPRNIVAEIFSYIKTDDVKHFIKFL